MLCPEGAHVPNESVAKEEETDRKKNKKIPGEGTGSVELHSFKNPKTWKKSITNFFRHQLRSTKSNDVSKLFHGLLPYSKETVHFSK